MISVFDNIDVKPVGHPMHEAFWFVLLESALGIRKRLDSLQLKEDINLDATQSEYWKAVWEVASSTTAGSVENFARRIDKFVFPNLEETRSRRELIQRLNPTESYKSY